MGGSKDGRGSRTTLPVDAPMRLTTVRGHSENFFGELPSEIHGPVSISEQDYLVGPGGKYEIGIWYEIGLPNIASTH